MFKLLAIACIAAVCAPGVLAQNRISISGRPASSMFRGNDGFAPVGRRSSIGITFRDGFHRRGFSRGPFFYGYGAPYFYSDYYEPNEQEYAAPQPVPEPAPQAKQEPLPDPVLLELRGNQWVRVTNFGETSVPASSTKAEAQLPQPPAILVYGDGHTEEISSYAIIGRAIYTKSNYWTSGTWTRTIQIADLDLPATFKQNQQRGVKFELPSGPDEIVIRP